MIDAQTQRVESAWLQWFQWFARLFRGTPANCVVMWGTGDPTGVISAPIGSIFLRVDGSVGATLYVKESGSDAAGWAAK